MKHDIRSLPTAKHLCAYSLVLFGSLHSLQVNAGDFGSSVGYVPNGNGGGSYVKFGEGTKMTNIPSGIPSAFRDIGSKGLEVRGSGSLPVGSAGRMLPVAVTGKVSNQAVGKALGRLVGVAGGPIGLAAVIGIPLIMDWLGDADIEVGQDGNFQKRETLSGTVCASNCFEYGTRSWYQSTTAAGDWRKTKLEACQVAMTALEQRNISVGQTSGNPMTLVNVDVCTFRNANGTYYSNWGYQTRAIPPYDTSEEKITPLSLDQALLELEDHQPDPNVLDEMYTIDKSGRYSDKVLKDLSITNVIASGPATLPGPESTSQTPAQNGEPAKTTTTKTDYNCTYVLADVTCAEKKTTTESSTAVDPNTGDPVTTQTVTTEQKEAETPEQKDPCIEHPNRNGCREDEFDTPDGEIPKTTKTITYIAENLGFGAGSCPANVTQTMHGMSTPITLVNWTDNCQKITTYAKPMILAMATFAALMIIFAGGRPE